MTGQVVTHIGQYLRADVNTGAPVPENRYVLSLFPRRIQIGPRKKLGMQTIMQRTFSTGSDLL